MDLVTYVGLDGLLYLFRVCDDECSTLFVRAKVPVLGVEWYGLLLFPRQLTFNWTRTGTTGPTDPRTNSGELNCPIVSCNTQGGGPLCLFRTHTSILTKGQSSCLFDKTIVKGKVRKFANYRLPRSGIGCPYYPCMQTSPCDVPVPAAESDKNKKI